MWKLSGRLSSPGLRPCLQVMGTAWNHLSSAPGKPSSCSAVQAHRLPPAHQEGLEGFESRINTPVCSLHATRASGEHPADLKMRPVKGSLALLNVKGSNYTVFQPHLSPCQLYRCSWVHPSHGSGHSSTHLCDQALSERHITHSLSQQISIIEKHTLIRICTDTSTSPSIMTVSCHDNTSTCNLLPLEQTLIPCVAPWSKALLGKGHSWTCQWPRDSNKQHLIKLF